MLENISNQEKKEYKAILIICNKNFDFSNQIITDKLYRELTNKEIFKSSVGYSFLNRLEELSKGESVDFDCICCKNKPARIKSVLCKECWELITDELQEKKKTTSHLTSFSEIESEIATSRNYTDQQKNDENMKVAHSQEIDMEWDETTCFAYLLTTATDLLMNEAVLNAIDEKKEENEKSEEITSFDPPPKKKRSLLGIIGIVIAIGVVAFFVCGITYGVYQAIVSDMEKNNSSTVSRELKDDINDSSVTRNNSSANTKVDDSNKKTTVEIIDEENSTENPDNYFLPQGGFSVYSMDEEVFLNEYKSLAENAVMEYSRETVSVSFGEREYKEEYHEIIREIYIEYKAERVHEGQIAFMFDGNNTVCTVILLAKDIQFSDSLIWLTGEGSRYSDIVDYRNKIIDNNGIIRFVENNSLYYCITYKEDADAYLSAITSDENYAQKKSGGKML